MLPQETDVEAFQENCLALLEALEASNEPIVIKRAGKPIAKLLSVQEEIALFGELGGVTGQGDIIAPVGNEWDAATE